MTPAAPLVGAVTMRPPAAFSSETANANRSTHAASDDSSTTSERLPSRLSTSLLHVKAARQNGLAGIATVLHAAAHHMPYSVQIAAHLHGGPHGRLIGPHHIGHTHVMFIAQRDQFVACGERIGHVHIDIG